MVTPDISFDTRAAFSSLITQIIEVPYLKFNRIELPNHISEFLYGGNSDILCTKWNILNLTKYKKVLLLDADTIIYENIDDLFTLPTPAAPFSSSFSKPLGSIKFHYTNEKDKTGYLYHGDQIKEQDIKNSLMQHGTVLIASTVLLSPNATDYADFCSSILNFNYMDVLSNFNGVQVASTAHPDNKLNELEINLIKQHLSSTQIFGFPNCFSGIAEQALAYFYTYIKKESFYNIHQRYNYFSWRSSFLINESPKILHIICKPKPWMKSQIHTDPVLNAIYELNASPQDTKVWKTYYEEFQTTQ
jgi:alpha-N-acetylglucosamine transferase